VVSLWSDIAHRLDATVLAPDSPYAGCVPQPAAPAAPAHRAEGADPRLVEISLALGIALAVAVAIAADLENTGAARPGAYLFAIGFGALMLVRRRAPRVVLILTIVAIFTYYVFDFPPIGIALPAVAALYSAAEAGHPRSALVGGAVLTGVAAVARIDEGLPAAYVVSYEFLTNVALVAAAIALGVSVRSRRETRQHQARLRMLSVAEQQRAAEHRIIAERMRIARDLHDLVGHSMSVIAVHGNVAAEAIGVDDAAAMRAVEQIRQITGRTMRELRATVKVLRTPALEETSRGAVGLSGVPRLAEMAAEAGVPVDLDIDVESPQLDAAIDAATYRIVQESLTNVIRHSGATRARVVARIDAGMLEVEVSDNGRGRQETDATQDPMRTEGGQGIAGMRERAALLGGELVAENGENGGFVVRARLPARLQP
jgi:signal transduction histidine kinase